MVSLLSLRIVIVPNYLRLFFINIHTGAPARELHETQNSPFNARPAVGQRYPLTA